MKKKGHYYAQNFKGQSMCIVCEIVDIMQVDTQARSTKNSITKSGFMMN